MFFLISKLFWLVADPINFMLILGVLGLLLSFGRAARFGHGLAAAAILLLAVTGFSPLGALLLRPLENRFPPLDHDDFGLNQSKIINVIASNNLERDAGGKPVSTFPHPALKAEIAAPAGIIVLGGALDAEMTAARGVPTLLGPGARLTTGAALARRFPNARLVFTGGTADMSGKGIPEAPAVRALWLSLGIPASQMLFEAKSRNTWENALFTKALVHPKPDETWLLVTSAWHMPRSMGIFRKVGFQVTAYPVDYWTYGDNRDLQVPHHALEAFGMLDHAMHEWIGLVAYHLTGKTDAWFPAP